MTTLSRIGRLFARSSRTVRKAPARFRPAFEVLEGRLTPSTLGTTALLERPTVGSDSDLVTVSGTYVTVAMLLSAAEQGVPAGRTPPLEPLAAK